MSPALGKTLEFDAHGNSPQLVIQTLALLLELSFGQEPWRNVVSIVGGRGAGLPQTTPVSHYTATTVKARRHQLRVQPIHPQCNLELPCFLIVAACVWTCGTDRRVNELPRLGTYVTSTTLRADTSSFIHDRGRLPIGRAGVWPTYRV